MFLFHVFLFFSSSVISQNVQAEAVACGCRHSHFLQRFVAGWVVAFVVLIRSSLLFSLISGRYPQDPRASNEQHFEKVAAMHELMKVRTAPPPLDLYALYDLYDL